MPSPRSPRAPLIVTGSITIEKLVPGGQGLGTAESGKKGFFWNALPGEIVTEYEITKNKSSYFEAIATKIESPSLYRIEPLDPCYLSTSPWQIMSYDYELSQKSELLHEQFRQAGIALEQEIFATPPRGAAAEQRKISFKVATDGNDFFYRNKMEYSLYYAHEDQCIHLAFKHRGSHRKLPIDHSSLERPEILAEAKRIIADLNARGEEARKYQTLLIRSDQHGHVSGGLLENGKSHPVFDNLTDTILGKTYSYSPNGFFQINLPVYEMALKAIKTSLGDSENVLDLYAGVGTIGLSVARDRNLTLVELNGAAYKELEKNCQGTGAEPVLSASEEALNYIKHNQTVIVDPPRAGLDDKLIEKLLEVKPETLIYLSCNPATQARDIKKLSAIYKITSCTPFNFFPRTPHLENLIVLCYNR